MHKKWKSLSERLNILKNLRKYSKISQASVIVIILLNLMAIPVIFINPYFFQILIDKVITNGQTDELTFVIA